MEEKIIDHYSLSGRSDTDNPDINLPDRILSGLNGAGKNLENLEVKDLSVIDQLHTGGHLATIGVLKKACLEPGAKVLDAGCGIGGSSRILAQEFKFNVTGIDIVEEFIATAQFLTELTGKNHDFNNLIEFKQGSILEIPFPDGEYDAVLSQHTLMNIQEKDVVFKEFSRVLKPGGLLFLHEVVQKSDIPIDLPVPWAASHDISFLNAWDTLLANLNKNGFELVHYSDEFAQARKWWTRVKEVAEKFLENPRPLGPHIIFGKNGKEFGKNMYSNIETKRISVVEAVLKKI